MKWGIDMSRRWDIDKVRELFEMEGCKLLENAYTNNRTKLKYIATCGHEHETTLTNFYSGKGRVCRECRYKHIGSKNRFDYDYIKEYFAKEGCTLISEEYKSNNIRLKYKAQCGHINNVSFMKFQSGTGRVCAKCSKSILYEYEDVKKAFEKEGCKLLEGTYINCKTKMKFIAKCGHIHKLTFDEFRNSNASKMCIKCQKIKTYSIDDIREIFDNENCYLLSSEYVPTVKLKYVATCGHKHSITLMKFITGQGRNCPRCSRPKGERHHNYNPNLTDKERIDNRDTMDVINWRNRVYERDQYTCKICNDSTGGNLNAHHLNGYNWDKCNRLNLDNGITLCDDCHNSFHKQFGYGDNTKEQFEQWKLNS